MISVMLCVAVIVAVTKRHQALFDKHGYDGYWRALRELRELKPSEAYAVYGAFGLMVALTGAVILIWFLDKVGSDLVPAAFYSQSSSLRVDASGWQVTRLHLGLTCVTFSLVQFVVVFVLVARHWDILKNYNRQDTFGLGLRELESQRPGSTKPIKLAIWVTLLNVPVFQVIAAVFF